uniref:DDE Tnp4 domain-containing protein n=1 Tax=Brassica oleracea var. oleracea TaxID=109376 RepID=A0A0D3BLW2_BRAOL
MDSRNNYTQSSSYVGLLYSQQGQKNSLFAQTQEAVRKDVEHVFGVLQARFAVVPSHLWYKDKIANIMRACIILHNMIVEDERSSSTHYKKNILNNDDVEEVMMIQRQRRRPTHKEVEDGWELRRRRAMHKKRPTKS